MYLVGARGQLTADYSIDASILTGSSASLVLAQAKRRASLLLQNISDTDMYVEFGCARAAATLTSGAVSSVAITNAGFNFTLPPLVQFCGGGRQVGSTRFYGIGQYGYDAPMDPATGHATLSGGAVNAVIVDHGGAGYLAAPFVRLTNDPGDPSGVAIPSATSGILLAKGGGSFYANGVTCMIDAIAVFCSASGKILTVKWMPGE